MERGPHIFIIAFNIVIHFVCKHYYFVFFNLTLPSYVSPLSKQGKFPKYKNTGKFIQARKRQNHYHNSSEYSITSTYINTSQHWKHGAFWMGSHSIIFMSTIQVELQASEAWNFIHWRALSVGVGHHIKLLGARWIQGFGVGAIPW